MNIYCSMKNKRKLSEIAIIVKILQIYHAFMTHLQFCIHTYASIYSIQNIWRYVLPFIFLTHAIQCVAHTHAHTRKKI